MRRHDRPPEKQFVDHGDRHTDVGHDLPKPWTPRATPVAAYWQANAYPWHNINYSRSAMMAHSDYAINGGPVQIGVNPDAVDPTVNTYGLMNPGRTVPIAAITDGTSNTYLAGERYISTDNYDDGNDPSGDWSPYTGHSWNICRWTYHDPANPGNSYFPRQDMPGYAQPRIFGGPHANNFNMALCDGSVRQISYTIDPQVHCWLGDRRDGLPIDGSKF